MAAVVKEYGGGGLALGGGREPRQHISSPSVSNRGAQITRKHTQKLPILG